MNSFIKKFRSVLVITLCLGITAPLTSHAFTMSKRATMSVLAIAAVTSPIWGTIAAGRWAFKHPLKATVAAATLAASIHTGKTYYDEHIETRNLKAAQIALLARDHSTETDNLVQETCAKYGIKIPQTLENDSDRLIAVQVIEQEINR